MTKNNPYYLFLFRAFIVGALFFVVGLMFPAFALAVENHVSSTSPRFNLSWEIRDPPTYGPNSSAGLDLVVTDDDEYLYVLQSIAPTGMTYYYVRLLKYVPGNPTPLWFVDVAPNDVGGSEAWRLLGLDSNGYIYVSNGSSLHKVSSSGSRVTNERWPVYTNTAAVGVNSKNEIYYGGKKFDSFGNVVLDPSGIPNRSFVVDKSSDSVYAIRGTFSAISVAKYDSNGNVATSWGENGLTAGEPFFGGQDYPRIAVDFRENVYLVLPSVAMESVQKFHVVRFNADGQKDRDDYYNALDFNAEENVADARTDARGNVYVFGKLSTIPSKGFLIVFKYSPDGYRVWDNFKFAPKITGADTIGAIAPSPVDDDKFYVTGTYKSRHGSPDPGWTSGVAMFVYGLEPPPPLPDLVVSSGPELNSGALEAGASVTFKGTVRNDGVVSAGSFQNRFQIDLGNDGSVDITLSPHPSINSLDVGVSEQVVSGSWVAQPGTHRVILCTDRPPDEPDPDGALSELDETNNCSSTTGSAGVISVFDYNLSSSGNITTNQGSAGSNTITRTLAGGTARSVSLSASGLPSGATASFANNPCNPTCSSTLTISTAQTTPVGSYPITVTGSLLGRTTQFTLTVSAYVDTTPPLPSPDVTVSLGAGDASCSEVNVSWTASGDSESGIDRYAVQRRLEGGSFSTIATVRPPAPLEYVDTTVSPATNYEYRVLAINGAGLRKSSAVRPIATTACQVSPDLIISSSPLMRDATTLQPLSTAEAGQQVYFTFSVRNNGTAATPGGFSNRVSIDLGNDGSIDAAISPDPQVSSPFSAGAVRSLASGSWIAQEGTHRVIACADYPLPGSVNESNETNNCNGQGISASYSVITIGFAPQCRDGIDNDGDGKLDFGAGPTNDPDCTSRDDNNEGADNFILSASPSLLTVTVVGGSSALATSSAALVTVTPQTGFQAGSQVILVLDKPPSHAVVQNAVSRFVRSGAIMPEVTLTFSDPSAAQFVSFRLGVPHNTSLGIYEPVVVRAQGTSKTVSLTLRVEDPSGSTGER